MPSTAPDTHLLGCARTRAPVALDRQVAALVEAGVHHTYSDQGGRASLDALLADATPVPS